MNLEENHEQSSPPLHPVKTVLRRVIKVLGYAAGVVFIIANPFSNIGAAWFFGSIVAMVLCGLAYMLVGEDIHLEPPPQSTSGKPSSSPRPE